MKTRLDIFMKSEGLTPSRLAEIISVQPSSISHLLAGRNKPGFDFIYKILERFPNLNPDWLILGTGEMYRGNNIGNSDNAPRSTSSTAVPKQKANLNSTQESSLSNVDANKVGNIVNEFDFPSLDTLDMVDIKMGSMSDDMKSAAATNSHYSQIDVPEDPHTANESLQSGSQPGLNSVPAHTISSSPIERIVIFFKNKTFNEYLSE